jgi:TPP-dependent pyruvate/acetoin dehydrogenase alpha subunit
MGPHSTADDRSRYQPSDEIERWGKLDPLLRFRMFLDTEGIIDPRFLDQVETEAKDLAASVRSGIAGAAPRDIREMFAWVWNDLPQGLARQRDDVATLMDDEGDGDA